MLADTPCFHAFSLSLYEAFQAREERQQRTAETAYDCWHLEFSDGTEDYAYTPVELAELLQGAIQDGVGVTSFSYTPF